MAEHAEDAVRTITVANTTPDLYAQEMDRRLGEWRSGALEPEFTRRQFLPLLVVTVILPALALIGGWFA